MHKNAQKSEEVDLCKQDGDGVITRSEIEELVRNLGGDLKCPKVGKLLNFQKEINFPNFLKLWKNFKDEQVKEAFEKYDKDKDGFITKNEIMEVVKNLEFVGDKEAEVEKCLKDLDVDGNGQISLAEFMLKWNI